MATSEGGNIGNTLCFVGASVYYVQRESKLLKVILAKLACRGNLCIVDAVETCFVGWRRLWKHC